MELRRPSSLQYSLILILARDLFIERGQWGKNTKLDFVSFSFIALPDPAPEFGKKTTAMKSRTLACFPEKAGISGIARSGRTLLPISGGCKSKRKGKSGPTFG
ncbi:hypothetical protein CEXT_185601 [Caerostris extrusa]|uniref:Uncharacterized protein n=1 Tax=Caerostris extrusa TaxID=172846 RepID=A0AAV4SBE8_CAEEX|nr:hypothetical protein CEXT_185601 [Caerostris extrusa]